MGYGATITPNWGISMDGLTWGYVENTLNKVINSFKKTIEVPTEFKEFIKEYMATYFGEYSSDDNQEISLNWDEMILNGVK